jgi:hypothetical protein
MGFHVEVNTVLRSDDFEPGGLKEGAVRPFRKAGSRVFADDMVIWLARMDWTPLAEIQVLSQARKKEGGQLLVEGEFAVLYVYPPAEREALKAVFVRMFERPAQAT